ncbi:acyltransferase [Microbacterium sp. NPDC056234]|uniref:acyltransferase family protein n=1 Tax=Microbacterium sp. NPDC056234 TaxID=3345757 RepID=UPI0035DE927F
MTTVAQRVAAASSPSPAAVRDTGIDLVRAACVIAVVILHALMVGVTVTDAGPVFANASDDSWWITPLSWVLQVMPLFFVIGGFAGWTAYRRARVQGGTAASFVAGRLQRLLVPALVVIAVVGSALAALAIAGVPADLLHIAGYRYAQPLWFLGVFLLCQALLPALAAAHERFPLRAIGALVLVSIAVDALRLSTGVEGLGFLNLAFVWLTLQQLGFFLADGRIDALGRRTRILTAVGAVAVLGGTMTAGIHSPDLIANINPPTTALLLVGVAHTMLLSLSRDRLSAWSRRPRLAALQGFVNKRAMTVYLWHMPVLLAMAGGAALFAVTAQSALPEPSGFAWWLTRPLWLATVLALTALLAVPLARLESRRTPAAGSARRLTVATTSGLIAIVLLLVVGTTPATALAAVLLILFALRMARAGVTARSTPSDAARIRG